MVYHITALLTLLPGDRNVTERVTWGKLSNPLQCKFYHNGFGLFVRQKWPSWHKPFKHWFGTHLGGSTMCSFCFSLFFLLFGISAKTLSNIIKTFSALLLQELHTVTRQCRLSHHDKIVPHDMWHTVVWKPTWSHVLSLRGCSLLLKLKH